MFKTKLQFKIHTILDLKIRNVAFKIYVNTYNWIFNAISHKINKKKGKRTPE